MKVKKKYHLELDYSLIVCFGWGFFKIPLKHLFLRNAFFPSNFFCRGNMGVSTEAIRDVRLCCGLFLVLLLVRQT